MDSLFESASKDKEANNSSIIEKRESLTSTILPYYSPKVSTYFIHVLVPIKPSFEVFSFIKYSNFSSICNFSSIEYLKYSSISIFEKTQILALLEYSV